MGIFVLILGILLLIVFATLERIKDKELIILITRACIFVAITFGGVLMNYLSEDNTIEQGAKLYIQHPKQFKVEYKCTITDSTITYTDTIVKLKVN